VSVVAHGRVTDRIDLQLVADERAALLRVAQLVAQGIQSADVFDVVCDEVARLFGTDLVTVAKFETDPPALIYVAFGKGIEGIHTGSRWELENVLASTVVFRTGRSTRIDQRDLTEASEPVAQAIRRLGIVSTVASPIVVEGNLWGAITASTRDDVLPSYAEDRLDKFCRIVATSIANAESREALGRLVEEQAALRRVATLVAQGAQFTRVCRAVCDEVGRLFGTDLVTVGRYEPDPEAVVAVAFGKGLDVVPIGIRLELDDALASTHVFRTGRSARVEPRDLSSAPEPVATTLGPLGLVSTVASPVVVEGHLWGAVTVSTKEGSLPDDAEERLDKFCEIVASSIANAESREALRQLADEQAALRRVATMVARGAPPERLFAVVAEEVARFVHVPVVSIVSYEDDGCATARASISERGELFAVGTRWSLEGTNVIAGVLESGRPVRIDDYTELDGPIAQNVRRSGLRSTVGIPILVGGRLWGAMVVCSVEIEPLPPETESRLVHFTELVATAIANAESREGLARLAEEQAALRRVATLVARTSPPDELFAAVTQEVGQLLHVDAAAMSRYEPNEAMTIVALWGTRADEYELGVTLPLGGRNLNTVIAETRHAARIDADRDSSGGVGGYFRATGLRSSVGAPIIVDDRLWGVIAAGTHHEQLLPPDSEARLADFTELIATAIANAESRGELAASRARIVTAADRTRREIERDLHDGIQQHLVSLLLSLRSAQAAVPPELQELQGALSGVADGLADVQSELLEMARGIHPATLARGGLAPALRTLARRSPIAVELDVRDEQRLPDPVEVAAYYVVSEALTNAAKHANASAVHVRVEVTEDALWAWIADDGIGGADPTRGSGLVGLKDRVEALGGVITVESPVGRGTSLHVELPITD
jgi:GAF domain-containing protein